jgi:putative ABC transport system ATP-binding protein
MATDLRSDPARSEGAAGFDPLAEGPALARALELCGEAAGNPISAEAAWRVTHELPADRGWIAGATSAARAMGLHAYTQRDPPGRGPGRRPAIVRTTEGRWLVVLARRGRRARAVILDARGEARVRLRADELREAAGAWPWLHLEPRRPLDAVSAHRHAEIADRPWQRLRAFLSLDARDLWIVLVHAIAIGGLTLATPIAVQALVNTIAFGSVLQPLVVLTALLFGGLLFSGALGVLSTYVVEVLQRRVFVRVAVDFGRRLTAMRRDVLDARHGPELVNRFFEVLTIQKALAVLLLDGLAITLQTIIGMILLGFYHPILLAFDVVLVLGLVLVLATGRGAVATGLRESAAKYETAAWMQDVTRSPVLVRSATASRWVAARAEMLCHGYLAARRSHFRILLRQIVGGFGLQIAAIVALLGVGGWLVIERQLTLGQLVAAELVIAAIGAGFAKLGPNLEKVYDLVVGVTKLGRVLDPPGEREGGVELDVRGPMPISLRGISIERGILRIGPVSAEIDPQARVRLAGSSGSGKSTMLEAIAGLRDAAAGSISIAGVDLRRADLGSVRDRVIVVRGTELLGATLLDNLRISRPALTEAELRPLLRLVDLERAIDRLPEGLETPLLPTGAPLSETQARRLVLARALASRPGVLLLDRALDGLALPPASRARLLDAVLGPHAPWTVVVVTDESDVAAACTRTLDLDTPAPEDAS